MFTKIEQVHNNKFKIYSINMITLDILYYTLGTLLVLTIGFFTIMSIIIYIEFKREEKHEKECVENATKIKDNKNVLNEVKHFTDALTNDLQDTLKETRKNKHIIVEFQHYFSGTYITKEEMLEIRDTVMGEEFADAISPWKTEKVEWNRNTKKYFIVIDITV